MTTVIWGGGRLGKATAQYLCERGDEVYIKTRTDVLPKKAKVIIDFSTPEATEEALCFALQYKIPLVVGVTGHSPVQKQKILLASKKIPVAYESNFSYGIYAMKKILAHAKKILPGWECGIIEFHRKDKADSPSGTALALNEIIKTDNIIPVRIGEEAGTHEVVFWGRGEKIVISHVAQSIQPFVTGAVNAAEYISKMPAGLYNLSHFFS